MLLGLMSCHSEGWLELRGTVASAADGSPLPGAELHLRFNVSDAAWALSCEEARAEAHPADVYLADEQGRFDVGKQVYGGGGPGCSYCERGVLCVSHDGFRSERIQFDDCNDADVASGQHALAVHLEAK